MASSSYDIFISYRRTDSKGETSGTNIARSIKQQLEMEGYRGRVFFDYCGITDGEFEKTILPAIEGSKVLLLILSKEALRRCVNEDDWVRREVIHAVNHNVKIVPINPDYKFDGYPEGFPEEMDIVKRMQHQCIHMDASFEQDVRSMIEKRIAPVTKPTPRGGKISFRILGIALAAVVVAGIAFGIINRTPVIQNETEPQEEVAAQTDEPAVADTSAEDFAKGEELFAAKRYEEAVQSYLKAAQQGHVDAEAALAYCYSKGMGVEKSQEEAVSWYRKAAEQGHMTSMFNLGICCMQGQGVKQDHAEAAKWYLKVADHGFTDAQLILGMYYETGQGVPLNKAEAIKWYRKAADNGNEKAVRNLKRLGQI